jgi:hypothetical protein
MTSRLDRRSIPIEVESVRRSLWRYPRLCHVRNGARDDMIGCDVIQRLQGQVSAARIRFTAPLTTPPVQPPSPRTRRGHARESRRMALVDSGTSWTRP